MLPFSYFILFYLIVRMRNTRKRHLVIKVDAVTYFNQRESLRVQMEQSNDQQHQRPTLIPIHLVFIENTERQI